MNTTSIRADTLTEDYMLNNFRQILPAWAQQCYKLMNMLANLLRKTRGYLLNNHSSKLSSIWAVTNQQNEFPSVQPRLLRALQPNKSQSSLAGWHLNSHILVVRSKHILAKWEPWQFTGCVKHVNVLSVTVTHSVTSLISPEPYQLNKSPSSNPLWLSRIQLAWCDLLTTIWVISFCEPSG